jgi:SAM-dependent methyltransferase
MKLSDNKTKVSSGMDRQAPSRGKWMKKNRYYYQDLEKLLKYNIPAQSSVLEIGCGTGQMLHAIDPKRGLGIDISPEMIRYARQNFQYLDFREMDAENIELEDRFEFIIISDTIGYFEDIQKAFNELHKISDGDTRIIITYHNFFWNPILKIAESIGMKMPQKRLNWLNLEDIKNLLALEDFDIIKTGKRFLFPFYVPLISTFINRYLAPLPIINRLCITGYLIARPVMDYKANDPKVSIVIPAMNEAGNIENAILRIPAMGTDTEIIFVEGHSTDNTLDEIKKVTEKYGPERNIRYFIQDGKGKWDAVRKGFKNSTGDILMILDADLTMPPEDLPKFYKAITTGKGEFINGSRLVYPMENEAMMTLNMMANKFFSIMFSWILGQRLKDTLCGTKVLSRLNYDKLLSNRKYFGDFDPFGDFDLIFGASKLNLKIVEVPIKYRAREYGSTNISRFRHGWILVKMMVYAMNKIKFV